MGIRIRYGIERGNTVPYPPLFDDIRRNHGFIDTRGRPDLVDEIPEARESVALAALLTSLALPGSRLVSLGCDLGQHDEPKARLETRRVAGGYVQVVARRGQDNEFEFLQSVAKAIEHRLKASAGTDRWEVDLKLAPVVCRMEEEVETQSIWIWFSGEHQQTTGRRRRESALSRQLGGSLQPFENRNWR